MLRLLDGNLDPTKLYSVRIEQNGPGANLRVKVSTDQDKGDIFCIVRRKVFILRKQERY